MEHVTGLAEAPETIWKAKETDHRTKTPFDIFAPAALVSLQIRDNNNKDQTQVIQVDVPPLDFLEFRLQLPIEREIGRELLVQTTVQETMVAIAIRHVELRLPEGRKAMVQPETARDPKQQLDAWKKVFNRAHEYLKTKNEK